MEHSQNIYTMYLHSRVVITEGWGGVQKGVGTVKFFPLHKKVIFFLSSNWIYSKTV